MRNFKIFIDICDIYLDLVDINTRKYTIPFMIMFVEADNPDGACECAVRRIINEIMSYGNELEKRILCRKVRKYIRIERIEPL